MATSTAENDAKLKIIQDLEIQMMSDFYNRMASTCHKKCIPPRYAESELGKGELVCIDRCVAKYIYVHEKIGKKLVSTIYSSAANDAINPPK